MLFQGYFLSAYAFLKTWSLLTDGLWTRLKTVALQSTMCQEPNGQLLHWSSAVGTITRGFKNEEGGKQRMVQPTEVGGGWQWEQKCGSTEKSVFS